MSLTSYRAAPPRVTFALPSMRLCLRTALDAPVFVHCLCCACVFGDMCMCVDCVGGPGGDRLSRALGHSIMGAGGFHVRVRDGIGWGPAAMATRSPDAISSRPLWGALGSGACVAFACAALDVRRCAGIVVGCGPLRGLVRAASPCGLGPGVDGCCAGRWPRAVGTWRLGVSRSGD